MTSWFKTGFGSIDNAYDNVPKKGVRRVWLKPEETKRYLFIDDDPTTFWEHTFKMAGDYHQEPCHVRNKISAECPIDREDLKCFPYFVGLHTVICMTPWFTKKGNEEVNFQREIHASKLGSQDKPGILKELQRIKSKHGRLRGLVIDVYRSGKKTESCGDKYEIIDKVDPKDIQKYAADQLGPYADRLNEKLPADKKVSVASLLKRNPWESFNFEEIVKPRPLAELRQMFGRDGSATGWDDEGGGGGGGGGSKGSKDDDGGGDDIPY